MSNTIGEASPALPSRTFTGERNFTFIKSLVFWTSQLYQQNWNPNLCISQILRQQFLKYTLNLEVLSVEDIVLQLIRL